MRPLRRRRTKRSAEGPGWVIEEAKKLLDSDARRHQRRPPWSELISPRRALVLFITLVPVSWMLRNWPWDVLPSLAPSDPRALQAVLWQVEGALAAIPIPLLILVTQLMSSEGNVLARPLPETLMRAAHLESTATVVLFGILRGGLDYVWFEGQAVLAVDVVLVFGLTVFMVTSSYVRVFSLIRLPRKLMEYSAEILEEKLEKSMDELWTVAHGNAVFLRELEGVGVRYSPFRMSTSEEWITIEMQREGVVGDVHVDGVCRVLRKYMTASVTDVEGEDLVATPLEPGKEGGWVHLMCGDAVRTGDVLLSLSPKRYKSEDSSGISRDLQLWTRMQ